MERTVAGVVFAGYYVTNAIWGWGISMMTYNS
jgi:hypothetical protein